MKVITILILPFFLLVPTLHAQVNSDEQGEVLVSLDYKDATLWEVFRDLSRQTTINFVLNQEIQDKKITLYLKDVSLEETLAAIVLIAELRYEVVGQNNYLFHPQQPD